MLNKRDNLFLIWDYWVSNTQKKKHFKISETQDKKQFLKLHLESLRFPNFRGRRDFKKVKIKAKENYI